MRYSTAALLGFLAVQQAAACDTCEWGEALGLPSCQSACNQCTSQQQQGLDFSQCPSGASSFGGLDFSGCSIGSWLGLKKRQSFIPRGGKRNLGDLFGGGGGGGGGGGSSGGGGDQCALGALTSSSGPSFSCGQGTSPFSISSMLVSCDQSTPVQLTYHYDTGAQAGQTCQQTAQLTSGSPNTITNSQCGGASRVDCALAPGAPVQSCNLGIHSVAFDCSGCNGGTPGAATSAPAAPPPAAATSAAAAPPPPAAPSAPAAAPPPPAAPSSPAVAPPPPPPAAPSAPAVPPPVAPPPPSVAPPPPAPPTSPAVAPPPPVSTPVVPPPAPPPSVPAPPPAASTGTSMSFPETPMQASSTPSYNISTSNTSPNSPATATTPGNYTYIIQSTQPIITTEVVYTTVTTCSGSTIHSNGNFTSVEVFPTVSTLLITSTQTVCTRCTAPPQTPSPASVIATTIAVSNTVQSVVVTQSVASSSSSAQPAPAPSLLPSCLQTWIKLTGCKDNSDSNCFCNDANFTKNVQECVSAWSNHQDQEQQALSYLAGICAPHIANNPGIITNIPSTITLQPVPAATAAPNSPQSAAPVAPGGQTAPPSAPTTVVSLSTTVTVQCSATSTALVSGSGVSVGSMNSGCTTTSVLNTQVTVPQVAFTTPQPGKVGLVAGTPAPAPAVATANSPAQPAASNAAPNSNANSPAAPLPAPPAAAPAGTGVTPYNRPSTTVQPFVGAAASVGTSSIFMSVVLAIAGFAVL